MRTYSKKKDSIIAKKKTNDILSDPIVSLKQLRENLRGEGGDL